MNDYRDAYRTFLLNKREPVTYILQLEELQECLNRGNKERSISIIEELLQTAKTQRIHVLEEYLIKILSRLVYIQGETEMMEFTYNDILLYLLKIKQYNQYADNNYYIQPHQWQPHFEKAILPAIEISFDACMTNECRGWSGKFNRDLLWQDTKELLSLIYLTDDEEISRRLREHYSSYKFSDY